MTDDLLLFLSKAVPQAILPEGLLALMLLALPVAVWARAYRTAGMLAVLSLGLFWACATPVVAHWAMGTLERQYMPRSAAMPHADVGIVLGGAVSAPPPLQNIELSDSVDRVWHAARLHRAGHVKRLIVVGGNLPWGAAAKPEAELIRQLLIELGVPAEAIRIGGASRNTYENAIEARSILQGPPFDTALLITSASHMPRALAVFRKADIPVDPAPCDFRATGDLAGTILDWMPQARAFAMTSEALREWLGYALYRWKGWL